MKTEQSTERLSAASLRKLAKSDNWREQIATLSHQQEVAVLKERYIDYYRECPIHKYAAANIGRNEDTVINWRKRDSNFEARVQEAKSEWIRRNVKQTRAEFKLERLEKELFAERKEVIGSVDMRLLGLQTMGLADETKTEGTSGQTPEVAQD